MCECGSKSSEFGFPGAPGAFSDPVGVSRRKFHQRKTPLKLASCLFILVALEAILVMGIPKSDEVNSVRRHHSQTEDTVVSGTLQSYGGQMCPQRRPTKTFVLRVKSLLQAFYAQRVKTRTIRKHQEELLRPRSISAEQNSINNPEKELQLSCVCRVRDAGRVLGAEPGGIIAVSHV